MLMSAEIKVCVTLLMHFLDLLYAKHNCGKFHDFRICVTDFRERAFYHPHPWAAPKRSIPNRIKAHLQKNFIPKIFNIHFQEISSRSIVIWLSTFYKVSEYFKYFIKIIVEGKMLCSLKKMFRKKSIFYVISTITVQYQHKSF